MLGWCELFTEKYHWTQQELMDTDLDYVLGMYVVSEKLAAAPRLTPIDAVGIF